MSERLVGWPCRAWERAKERANRATIKSTLWFEAFISHRNAEGNSRDFPFWRTRGMHRTVKEDEASLLEGIGDTQATVREVFTTHMSFDIIDPS